MADISGVLTTSQIERLNEIAKDEINNKKLKSQTLDQDAFLKILTTQLQNQDPMSPMQDAEFIGQMAQFSSVSQLTSLNAQMEKLNTIDDNLASLTNSISSLSGNSDDDTKDGLNQKILNELIKLNKAFEAYNG